ncbi:MAG: heat-shock protein Hsp20 [Porticoccaceae bacterium]|jgi:HSP20 family protein|nr:heat-shock protein Hsp20 [Porticoccaceae bacterium]
MAFSFLSRDMFADLERLHRELQQAFEGGPSIRGATLGGFPAVNVGSTPHSIELYAYLPGLEPGSIEVDLERGTLSISGERAASLPQNGEKSVVHINERFAGRFRRAVSLPDDIDPEGVSADYRDGVLHVSVKRRAEALPRRISVQ